MFVVFNGGALEHLVVATASPARVEHRLVYRLMKRIVCGAKDAEY
jgi:hypothetical protein